MSDFYIDNAMTWVQFRMAGGKKSLLAYFVAYAVLVGGFVFLTVNLARPHNRPEVYESWVLGLMTIQMIAMLIGAPLRVFLSVRKDITSGRLESHRLMPTAPAQAVLGYIVGSAGHIYLLCAVNFGLSAVICSMSRLSVDALAVVNVSVLGLSVLLCGIAALMAFFIGGIVLIVAMIVGGILLVNLTMISRAAPGLLFLITPLMSPATLSLRQNPKNVYEPLAIGLLCQAIVVGICIRGAARRYVSDLNVALPVMAMLVLQGLWCGMSLLAIEKFHFLDRFTFRGMISAAAETQTALVVGVTIAAGALGSHVWTRQAHEARRAHGMPTRTPLPFIALLLICIGLLLPLVLLLKPEPFVIDRLLVLVSAGIFLAQVYCFMRIAYSRWRWPNLLTVVFIGLLWLGPVLAWSIFNAVSDNQDTDVTLGTASMLGVASRVYTVDIFDDQPATMPALPATSMPYYPLPREALRLVNPAERAGIFAGIGFQAGLLLVCLGVSAWLRKRPITLGDPVPPTLPGQANFQLQSVDATQRTLQDEQA